MQARTGSLLLVGLGVSIAALDTALNVAFPAVTAAFDLPVRSIQWVVIAYVLTYASIMLVCGRLGDMFGYRRVFRAGLAISIVALALCAMAQDFVSFLAFRALQGVGTALVLSCGAALATSLFAESERTRVLGHYGTMFAAGVALGPVIGGLAIDAFGWPGVFWLRIPIAAAALLGSYAMPATARGGTAGGFDAIGAALLALGLSAVLLAIALLQEPAVGLVVSGALAAGGLACLALFLRHAARAAAPILRLQLFADPWFSAVNLANVVMHLVSFAPLLLAPYYLERIVGLPPTDVGFVLAVWAVGAMAGAWLAGRLGSSVAHDALAFASGGLLCVGLFLSAFFAADTTIAFIALALFAQGMALGVFQVAYTDLVMATLPASQRGIASSLAMLTRTLGIVSGATVLGAVFALRQRVHMGRGDGTDASFLNAFGDVFAAASVALALFLLALGAVRLRTRKVR